MITGKLLIIAGALIILLGIIILYAPWLFNWFGKLPGDIHYKSQNARVFIPFTSMIVVSVLLSIVVNVFFGK